MKAIIRIAAAVIILIFCAAWTAFADGPISLQLDGQTVNTDVAPIIENGRTLVPYRALLESMGAEVFWESKAEMATAILGSHRVQVTINNATAFVNGSIKEMDVPPRIIDGRTMIPLRFVLENLKCDVNWNNDSRTVIITSPQNEGPTEVTKIEYEETESGYHIIASGSDVFKSTRAFAYKEPERYGIDIFNAVFPDKVGTILTDNEVFNSIRYSQFNDDTVRIVVDLNDKVAGRVRLSDDRATVFIDFEKAVTAINRGERRDDDSNDPINWKELPDEDKDDAAILPELDWRATGKLIAIDAGHGGKDPGAAGKINGREVIVERDLNLAIALRLNQLLSSAGASTVLLRDSDITMSLYSRPEAANALNADLLISVHNNSAETATPNGTEVLYYDKVGTESYGITSKEVAAFMQKELVLETGLKDRGIINCPHLAVLNKSLMPAVIIEGGFLSNPDDLQVMLTDEFKEAYAVAAARGIINALNSWAER
ncbi:MAG TPA: N-acetylmuramoyl-L-alanine amidase family protein [Bacillota bacterium]|jgi:N-acetylmuramoyl-L-alanine amidase|nr:N-acetylmuramoyl-L-alanine amidase family protein [Bacillota bacterium]